MDESLLRFDKNQKYLVFDTETEGLNLIRSRPWQVAWLVVEGGKILEKHDMFLDWPNLDVSAGAAKITGFTMKEYNKRKESPRKVWEKFSKHLYDEDTFIVGQNLLGFDVYMVNIWRELMKLEADYSYVERIIDTRALAVAIAKDIPVDKDDFISWQYRLINHRKRNLQIHQRTRVRIRHK